MSEPIFISPTTFEKASKIMRQSSEIPNTRNIQNVNTGGEEYTAQIQQYRIRYHVDTSKICSQGNLALQKFSNFEFGSSDQKQEIESYQKMIKQIEDQRSSINSVLDMYKRIRNGGNKPNDDTDE